MLQFLSKDLILGFTDVELLTATYHIIHQAFLDVQQFSTSFVTTKKANLWREVCQTISDDVLLTYFDEDWLGAAQCFNCKLVLTGYLHENTGWGRMEAVVVPVDGDERITNGILNLLTEHFPAYHEREVKAYIQNIWSTAYRLWMESVDKTATA